MYLSSGDGCVTLKTTVGTTVMSKRACVMAHIGSAPSPSSAVPIINAFLTDGDAIMMMTVATILMKKTAQVSNARYHLYDH